MALIQNNVELTDHGRLLVSVFSESVALPAQNAHIQIGLSGSDGQPIHAIDEMITDSSGQTSEVNLPAPPIDYSMAPGEPVPYSQYDLTVTMDGFVPTEIKGVQVFPGTTALQEIRLQAGNVRESQVITIPPPVLAGNYPARISEDSVKPLPPSKGYVVLPDPVIPEFVVVHDGKPDNASAPNYWIPFKDYIKNVASCEIYSNWPEATIRANVLAILSFALNRIYTEWYRSKGYNFTVTSSTAYDQAFSYGRTFYQEISAIVDEVFTTFITRPDIRQPLLTQYCDGRKVRCPGWMTQWGSKDLGDQGFSAMNILKNFYGSDVFLMQADKVEGVPSSFPGHNLQTGSTGNDVRTIQEQLNAISVNYPAINKLRVDGIFGADTRSSVRTFQGVFNLPQTGIVDFGTWYKISYIYVSVTRMAELG